MNRQAPIYAIIGNGRVARHLCHYFQLINISFIHWHRAQSAISLNNAIDQASHIIVAISDAHIESFINTLARQNKIFIHCSGALCTDTAWTAHPLQTFAHELYSMDEYQTIPFIVEKEGPTFCELFPQLPNPSFSIYRQQKPYYHALCVMANNFTTMLWQKAFHAFEETLQIERSALIPILQQTCHNLINHPDTALTGPIVRNDKPTIQANLTSLEEDEFYDIYKAFAHSIKTVENT